MIADSVDTKTAAYRVLLGHHGADFMSHFEAYVHAHGGLSRYRKFQWAYETLLHQPLTQVPWRVIVLREHIKSINNNIVKIIQPTNKSINLASSINQISLLNCPSC